LLHRGACELIVVRTEKSATALVLRRGALAILEFDNKRLTPDVEKKLRTTDWTATRIDRAAGPPQPSTQTAKAESGDASTATEELARGKFATPDVVISTPMKTVSSSEISAAVRSRLSPATSTLPASDNASTAYDVPSNPMPAAPSAEIAAIPRDVLSDPSPSAGHRMRGLKITASAAAVAGDDTMFAGSLRMVCLPDLLEFCRHGRRTGMLFCHLGDSMGSVTLRRGRILDAESPKTATATLLTRLLESGGASEEQVKELDLASDNGSDDEAVGRLLIDAGFTDPEAVRKVMLDQIKESVEEMIGWADGTFAFHPMEEDPSVSQDSAIDPEIILLQIFKEQDEKGRDEESD
jgi:hypothetical protein